MSSELVLIELTQGMVAWTTREAYDRLDLGRTKWFLDCSGTNGSKGKRRFVKRHRSKGYACGKRGPERYSDGRLRQKYLHVEVAEAFLGTRPSPRHTVDHKNRIKTDCRPENLRWATPKEQARNRTRGTTQWPAGLELAYSS